MKLGIKAIITINMHSYDTLAVLPIGYPCDVSTGKTVLNDVFFYMHITTYFGTRFWANLSADWK